MRRLAPDKPSCLFLLLLLLSHGLRLYLKRWAILAPLTPKAYNMVDRLPPELLFDIIQLAARSWRFSDRQTVVHLARTSTTLYELVSPILYRTIILTDRNAPAFINFAKDEGNAVLAKRVCGHARALHDFRSASIGQLPSRLFSSLECIHSMGYVIQGIADANSPCPLRHISLRSADFELISSRWLPPHARDLVTHMIGYLPIFALHSPWEKIMANPGGWIGSNIVRPFAGLTHLALILIGVQTPDQDWQDFEDFDFVALEKALREVLGYSRIQCLVLRVCGLHAERRWDEIQIIVRAINDSRLKVWHDKRPLSSWEYHHVLEVADVISDKDVWSEAQSIA